MQKSASSATKSDISETKPKRGRKSKKDLMNSVGLFDAPIVPDLNKEEAIENTDKDNTMKNENDTKNDDATTKTTSSNTIKKRGRKPKGGKIISETVKAESTYIAKPNIILHLKCSLNDVGISQTTNISGYNIADGQMNYEFISQKNECAIESNDEENVENLPEESTSAAQNDAIAAKQKKRIFKKIKELEQMLHLNRAFDKKSACFWCTCDFDTPPIHIVKYCINDVYHVYGCFCTPECGVAHLMKENIDISVKFERYHLMNYIYKKVYDYDRNIKPAPDPHYLLDKFCGNLSKQEYRELIENDRLFLISDKPMTRIFPELHEDTNDFILNRKIIQSNAYKIKPQASTKHISNKINIVNDNFNI